MLKPKEKNEEVKWKMLSSVNSIESIKKENKPVMIDFMRTGAQCKELDEYTYTNPDIIELSKSFNTIKIDLTKKMKNYLKYKIKGLPVVIFMDSKGNEKEDLRVTGF